MISGQKLTQNHPLNEKSRRENLERENKGRLVGEEEYVRDSIHTYMLNAHVDHEGEKNTRRGG